jgi:hypothetical protein
MRERLQSRPRRCSGAAGRLPGRTESSPQPENPRAMAASERSAASPAPAQPIPIATPPAPGPIEAVDRAALVQTVFGLDPSDMAQLVTRIEGAATHVSHHGTVPERAAELIRWVESSTGPGLAAIRAALEKPPPARSPFFMPFPRNSGFVGRSDDLDRLHAALQLRGPKTTLPNCVLYTSPYRTTKRKVMRTSARLHNP